MQLGSVIIDVEEQKITKKAISFLYPDSQHKAVAETADVILFELPEPMRQYWVNHQE